MKWYDYILILYIMAVSTSVAITTDNRFEAVTHKEYQIIDAKQNTDFTYTVGLDRGDGYFTITQSLDKFMCLGISTDSIILYSNQ